MTRLDGVDQAIHCFCVHLALFERGRERQLKQIIGHIEALTQQGPTIVAGDFNDWRNRIGAPMKAAGFEEVFEVTAAAPVAVAAAAPAAGGAAGGGDAAEEKDSFDVVLEAAGDKKIQVIKEVRALTNLGLGEAKALVDGAPATILEGANKETADKAMAAIEEAGGTVTLK